MKHYIERSLSYPEYIGLIERLLADGKTTGPVQSAEKTNFTQLNRQRMRRLDKTVELLPQVREAARAVERPQIWLVITEGWCGDASQIIPVIEKIAAESVNIETRYILRDENPDLMDRFLTGGARSIPKLIALDAASLEVLGTWGARPAAAQDEFDRLRTRGLEKPAVMEGLQRWYNADKGRSLQAEFEALLKDWGTSVKAGVAAA